MHTMKLMQQTRQATPLFWAAILALYPTPSRADDWASAPPMPTPRFSLAATASPDGQTIYALGGARAIGFSRGFDVVEAYDTSTQTWSSLQEMLFQRFGLAAATDSAGRVYAIGGAGYFGGPLLAEVEVYDPATGAWTLAAPLPTRRLFLAAATGSDGTIYALGGANTFGEPFDTVEAYDPASDTWSEVAPMPTARAGLAAVVTGGKLYVLGGYNLASPTLDTVEVYDPSTDSWSTVAAMPTARRYLAAAIGPDGRIYALGGMTWDGLAYSRADTVEAYDPAKDTWSTIVSMPTPRWGLAAATDADGRIFALGGLGATGLLNTVEVYGP